LKADRVLIDERKGYKAALQRGLYATTTLGLLEEAPHRGLIDFEMTIDRLAKATTFYVTEDVLEEFRRRVREQHNAQAQDRKRRDKLAHEQSGERG
jgi:predicted nucleic acid-binding protein